MDELIETNVAREDYATSPVPLDRRYTPFSMGMLWITMVSGFPSVLIGFEWHKAGFTLTQIFAGAAISCVVLLGYAIVASLLGARTGLSFALLTRGVFGKKGSQTISAIQTFLFLIWYALVANFVASEINGLFDTHLSLEVIAASSAILMAANNLFGFAGVANFAKYVAAPVLIVWIFTLFGKTAIMTSPVVWHEHGATTFMYSLSVVSSFVIGYSVWGNEPDFWRFGRPKVLPTVLPLVGSILIGQIIFPVSGYLLSRLVGSTDIATATGAVTNFSMGGAPLVAAIVLTAGYFAAGDANLYGAINSIENMHTFVRRKLVMAMMAFTAFVAVLLTHWGKAFEVLSSFNSILLPCVTIILACDHWLFKDQSHGASEWREEKIVPWRWQALVALALAWIVGMATAGVLPGMDAMHLGIWPLFAWTVAAASYVLLRRK